MPMTRWGDFELRRQIGRGGFGKVFCAFHPTLRQEVALKLIPVPSGSQHDIEKVLEEPRRLASVRHQHVVVVHDARYSEGHVGICMELIRGESLAQIVARSGAFGVDETVSCCKRVCRALAAIHRAGLVHNDVKAENVMREDGGRVVLMDFGAGRSLRDDDPAAGLHFLGTPSYMAPELFDLRDPAPTSDIYSVGVLMFYLLTGRFPVESRSLALLGEAHANGTRLRVTDFRDDVPARLVHVLDRALERRPEDRYQTPGELLHDLTKRPRSLPRATPASQPDVPARHPSSGVKLVAGIAAAALAAVGGVGFMACKAYEVMFGLTGEFADDGLADWMIIGLRTLPLPVFYAVMAVTAFVGLRFAWRVLSGLPPIANRWKDSAVTRLPGAPAGPGVFDRTTLGTGLLLAQVVALASVYWRFHDLITAFSTPIVDGLTGTHARLAPANEGEWLWYCGVTSILALAAAAAWARLLGRTGIRGEGLAAPAAGLALTVVMALMPLIPWRLVQQSTFQLAQFESERCFVLSQGASRVLLHCPGHAPGNVVVGRQDARLRVLDLQRNIFASAPASAQEVR